MAKVKAVSRKETPEVENERIYNFGEFFDSAKEHDASMIKFVLDEVRDKGISRRTVMRDALAVYLEERANNDRIGPYTSEFMAEQTEREAERERVRAEKAAAREKRNAEKAEQKVVKIQEMVAALQQIKGVTRKQAGMVAEALPSYVKIKTTGVEKLQEIGQLSAAAAAAVMEYASTQLKGNGEGAKASNGEGKPQASAKASPKGKAKGKAKGKREALAPEPEVLAPEPVEYTTFTVADAADQLAVSRIRVTKLVKAGTLKGSVDKDEVHLPTKAVEAAADDRLDLALKLSK